MQAYVYLNVQLQTVSYGNIRQAQLYNYCHTALLIGGHLCTTVSRTSNQVDETNAFHRHRQPMMSQNATVAKPKCLSSSVFSNL